MVLDCSSETPLRDEQVEIEDHFEGFLHLPCSRVVLTCHKPYFQNNV